jgi:phage baseplate assembly protein gpV
MRSFGGPQPNTGDMALCGVYYAIVTQNKDEQKLARVKVRFPWLPGGDKDQSAWAWVAVPMNGDKFGTFTLPEVEDTVMVVFMAGDIRHPVVIGGNWNKVDKPPEVNENGKNDFRFIKSRSGHRMLLDDSDKTKVVLTDYTNSNYAGVGNYPEGGDSPNKMELQTQDAINGSPTKGAALASLEGTLNVWCPNGTLTVKATHVEITASAKADIKAGADLTLEGGMSGECASSSPSTYKGSKVKING